MFFNKNVYFICLRIYRPTYYIVGLQATGEQMQRSMEQMQRSMEQMQRSNEQMQRSLDQMQRSMEQMQRSMEEIKLQNRRFVNIGSEMEQEIEGKHPVDKL